MTIDPHSTEHTWNAELTRLEADVSATEALLLDLSGTGPGATGPDSSPATGTGPWSPPTDLGPIPESLLVRAQEVLQRQLRVAEALQQAQASNTRQRGFAARVTDATATRVSPAYLDVNA